MSNNNEYSGTLVSGWNDNGSYSRLQYLSDNSINDLNEIITIITEGLSKFDKSNNTRLEIRLSIPQENENYIYLIQKAFPQIETSIKKFHGSNNIYLILAYNKNERQLENSEILEIRNYVKEKVSNLINEREEIGLENYGLQKLNELIRDGFYFESKNFNSSEVFNLWSETFGWDLEDIELLINNNGKDSFLYGLRNSQKELVSVVLIIGGETTEWTTREDYQGRGLIDPLLIYANCSQINILGKDEYRLYVHARYNRSIGPSIRSGMNFLLDDNRNFLLINHVTIGNEYQTFVEGTLDPELYTENLISSYLSLNTKI